MKRVVSSSIITLFIIVAIAATFLYLKNFRGKGGDPLKAIPADAAFLISYPPDADNLGAFMEMNAWTVLRNSPSMNRLAIQLHKFDSCLKSTTSLSTFLSGTPLLISGHVTGAGTFDFLFLKSLDNGQSEASADAVMLSLLGENMAWTKRNYDGNTIRETTLEDGKTVTYVVAKGLFMASATPFLVEDALRQMKLGKPVISGSDLMEALYQGNMPKLCLNFMNFPMFSGVFIEPGTFDGMTTLKNYGNWAVMKVSPHKHKLQFSGFMFNTDSTHLIDCFRGQNPVVKNLMKILPRKAAIINYYGTDDMKTFHNRLVNNFFSDETNQKNRQLLNNYYKKYKVNPGDKIFEWLGDEYALVITEPSGTNYDNHTFAVLKARDINKAKKSLVAMCKTIDKKNNSSTKEEMYNGHSIGNINLNGVIPAVFGETFSKVNKMYFTDIEDYIVIGNQAAAIRSFIDEFKSGLLLYKTDYYQDLSSQYSEKCNHFVFANPRYAIPIFKTMANETWKKNADLYKEVVKSISSVAFQYSNAGDEGSVQASLSFLKEEKAQGADQVFAIETDSSVSMKPLLTTDPVTKTRQILFQDDAGNLYLCDNSGNILWKQPVDGKIMGELYEIDLFKNNSRQFLFNTDEYLYLIDTKGSPVGNYPIRLPALATNGVAAFDFDKNRDFKIYIACANKKIYAYLPSGKPLPGWNFQNSIGLVTDPIRTVTLNGKEMLFINDREGAICLTNRFGEQSISLSKKGTPAENTGIFTTLSGSILFSDVSGSVVEILPDGSVQTVSLEIAGPDHGFLYTDVDADGSPDYVFINGNELTAYNTQLVMIYRKEFEFPVEGRIELIRMQNIEPLMAIRSVQSNQIWLLKTDGNIYPGFPVKGSAPVVMDELNLDGKKNLVAGGNNNLVYVYSLN